MSVMFQTRPVFVVFSRDSFDLITANMLSKEDIAKARYTDYRSLPLTGPVYVYSKIPSDIKDRNEVITATMSGKDLPQFPQYYQPYAEHISVAGQAAKPITELKKLNPDRVAEIEKAVSATGQKEADLGFLPLRAKYGDIAVIVEKSGKVLTTLQMRPW
jgi:hypothetical protein